MRSSVLLVGGLATASAVKSLKPSPVTRVVELIKSLKTEIEADGKSEQATYDKFACWCEDTTARKAAAIDKDRDTIDQLSKKIVDLKGQVGTLKVDLDQVKKDIAANLKSQEEATALRQKEHDEYATTRLDKEQATAALKKAVDVLQGAGSGGAKSKKSALQEAQTLSVVAGVRRALKLMPKDSGIDDESINMVKSFLRNPTGESKAFLQATNNPFGDYAPASTQILGILKNMYDSFTGDLQEQNTDEATKQKSFEELIETKQEELAALEATKAAKTASLGEKTKEMADAKTLREETEVSLKDNEAFFADTKEACAAKADEWAERTRLRTEELAGIGQALKTLDSPEARATFESSASMFLQFSSQNVNFNKALNKIKSMATATHSLRLASLAVTLKLKSKTGRDAFKDVLNEIHKMIANLRQEEQDDIDHRDFCAENKNALGGEKDSLEHTKKNKTAKKERLEAKSQSLQDEIDATKKAIEEQEKELADALNTRNEEHEEYIKALKDDKAAVALLAKAIGQMSAFYSNNKIALAQDPSYTEDPDKAPETFGDKPYGGRKSESTGVFAILEMIKEDIEKEIGESKKAEADATTEYEKMRAAGRKTVQGLTDLTNSLSKEKAATDTKVANLEGDIEDLDGMINGNAGEMEAMLENCNWIETSFDTRRTKRIAEINGLETALQFLQGGGEGDAAHLKSYEGPLF